MKHRPIFNRDVKLQPLRGRSRRGLHRLTFAGLLGSAVLATLLLWGGDPDPVEAKIQASASGEQRIALQLPEITPRAVSAPVRETRQDDIATPGAKPAGREVSAIAAVEAGVSDTDTDAAAEVEYQPLLLAVPAQMSEAPAAIPTEPASYTTSEYEWHDVTVKSGDSLAVIFSRLGISAQQLHSLLAHGSPVDNLKKIYPGQTLRLQTNSDNQLNALVYQIDKLTSLEAFRIGDDFSVGTVHRTPERRVRNISFDINSSLFIAAQHAGLSDRLTMELSGIFAWDVDFALDIREGDHFTVLYEEQYLDGDNIGGEKIIAAEFVNQGRKHHAIRYTDDDGQSDFYSLDAKSMRKTFLRTPVEFSRISSRFNLARKHPILNRIRAHKGVDYAARRGTPVKATANGKIVHRGKKGGYGNTIIIQHGTRYSTLYAHLSKFRSNLKTGSRVKQGQTIGYVGSTGLASGPHLHYEFRVDGVHRDPLRTKLPGAKPLAKKHLADFNQKADELLAQLNLVRNIQLASK